MTAYDPKTNTYSSAASSALDSVRRLPDSSLTALYREAMKRNTDEPTGDVTRQRMEERVARYVMSSRKGRRSLAERRRLDRERKRKAREEGSR